MFDVQELKARYDLRRIVENDLGPSHGHGFKALRWRCPFHDEHKGYSLLVWTDNWRCLGACHMGGDVIFWLQRYRGMSFAEACEYLGAEEKPERTARDLRNERWPGRFIPEAQPPADDWQAEASRVAGYAESMLWSPEGDRARRYLKQRGLTEETILRARLGLIPGRSQEWLRLGRLTVPCGICIPWFVGRELWAVKVRRAAGQPKYIQIAGGSSHGLYNAAALEGHETVLFVEGEFDALLAEQECSGLVGVATLGSAAGTLNPHWLPLLLCCRTILVAYDADEAGMKGASRLQAQTRRARVIQLPWGKDITEFVLQGGSVRQWLDEIL